MFGQCWKRSGYKLQILWFFLQIDYFFLISVFHVIWGKISSEAIRSDSQLDVYRFHDSTNCPTATNWCLDSICQSQILFEIIVHRISCVSIKNQGLFRFQSHNLDFVNRGPANFISAAFSGRSLDTGEESGKEKRLVSFSIVNKMSLFQK